jgi:hypothetical protein
MHFENTISASYSHSRITRSSGMISSFFITVDFKNVISIKYQSARPIKYVSL